MTQRLEVKELAVNSLTFAYGQRTVVDNVSFNAKSGELVAIVGPNGCGKSTLLRLIVGELTPSSGSVTLDGVDARRMGHLARASRLSLVPQLAAAPFGYTVQEMVLMSRHAAHSQGGLMGMGFETSDDLRLAGEAMWAADVHHLTDRRVNELSGGERQRVAIARAFTQDTAVMLLDEPTSSLDLFHQLELMEQLQKMTFDGRIALLVTHDLNLAAAHATRVIVMDTGKIQADGPTSQVLTPAVLEPVYRVKIERSPDGTLRFKRNTP